MSLNKEDAFVVDGKLALPYQYFAGRLGSRFIISLRDKRKIIGVECKSCGKVFVLPRKTCEKCMSELSGNVVELSGEGEVMRYTVVRYEDKHLPRKPPYVLALIKLDGADTSMAHIVEGVALEKMVKGMRVKAVFSDKPTNTILDIDHFEPVDC